MARAVLFLDLRRVSLAVSLAAGLAAGLGGCASGVMLDQLPASIGGEPAELPAKPAVAYQYPAVHDMPPTRADTPMNDIEQVRLEKELQSARDRQEGLYGQAPKPASGAKSRPAAAKDDQSSGATTNP